MAASNLIRYLGPANARGPSTTSNGGKQGSSAPGTFNDLPDNSNDQHVFGANGWMKLGYVGTTAQRLVNPPANTQYLDTTLSKVVFYDGNAWRDPFSGSVV